MIGKRVQLKKHIPNLFGTIIKLHLLKDSPAWRKEDLWIVHWDDGRKGIVDKNNILER